MISLLFSIPVVQTSGSTQNNAVMKVVLITNNMITLNQRIMKIKTKNQKYNSVLDNQQELFHLIMHFQEEFKSTIKLSQKSLKKQEQYLLNLNSMVLLDQLSHKWQQKVLNLYLIIFQIKEDQIIICLVSIYQEKLEDPNLNSQLEELMIAYIMEN